MARDLRPQPGQPFAKLVIRKWIELLGWLQMHSPKGATAKTYWVEVDLSPTGSSPLDTASWLPANSLIHAVTYRVITALAGGSSVNLGDSSSGTRFFSGLTQTINATGVKTLSGSDAVQASAGTLRLGWTGTMTAGKIRISALVTTAYAPEESLA